MGGYRPLTHEASEVWIPAPSLHTVAARAIINTTAPSITLPNGSNVHAYAYVTLPEGWKSFDISAVWTNLTTAEGAVAFECRYAVRDVGENAGGVDAGGTYRFHEAPAQNAIAVSPIETSIPTNGKRHLFFFLARRIGGTLSGDAALLGALLTRKS